jgi:hypothetical protein
MKKEVWIDGQIWKIRVRKRMPKDTLGITQAEKKQFIITAAITDKEVFDEVLCHEIAHAFLLRGGLHNTISPELTEDICDTIGIQLSKFIKDNFVNDK